MFHTSILFFTARGFIFFAPFWWFWYNDAFIY
jgi:hypothetical protein